MKEIFVRAILDVAENCNGNFVTPCCVLVISRNFIVGFLNLFVHKHQLQENQLEVYCGAAYK
jgi:hypothetical protein